MISIVMHSYVYFRVKKNNFVDKIPKVRYYDVSVGIWRKEEEPEIL